MIVDDRYLRQRRVAEIGDAGQARLEAAVVRVPASPSGEIARRYLARAGVSVEVDAELTDEESPHERCFRHEAPRELTRGAWRALRELRRIVGLEAP